MSAELIACIAVIVAGDGVRLHQRFPRRRQRDRHLGLDPRADPAGRAGHRGGRQLRSAPFLGGKVADDRRRGAGRPAAGLASLGVVFAGADRRDRLEPDHLVLRHPVLVLARPVRRAGRRDAVRAGGSPVGRHRRQGHHPDGRLAAGRLRARATWSMLAVLWIFRRVHPGSSTAASGSPSRSRRSRWRSATACRTPPRPWASSAWPCTSAVPGQPPTHIPLWVYYSPAAVLAARHVRRRLADHPHPRPQDHPPRPAGGLRRRDGRQRGAVHRGSGSGCRSRPPTRSPRRSWASARRRASRAVRWGVAGNIVVAWVLTFPAAAAIAASSTSSSNPSSEKARVPAFARLRGGGDGLLSVGGGVAA